MIPVMFFLIMKITEIRQITVQISILSRVKLYINGLCRVRGEGITCH
jgi:chemotaxis signal transduction protein